MLGTAAGHGECNHAVLLISTDVGVHRARKYPAVNSSGIRSHGHGACFERRKPQQMRRQLSAAWRNGGGGAASDSYTGEAADLPTVGVLGGGQLGKMLAVAAVSACSGRIWLQPHPPRRHARRALGTLIDLHTSPRTAPDTVQGSKAAIIAERRTCCTLRRSSACRSVCWTPPRGAPPRPWRRRRRAASATRRP